MLDRQSARASSSVVRTLLVVLLLAGCAGGRGPSVDGIASLRRVAFDVDSTLLDTTLEQVGLAPTDPPGPPPLLLFLHGRGGSPESMLSGLDAPGELARLGGDAPAIVFVNGGTGGTYFHDRDTGAWASYVVEEVIPEAVEEMNADPTRVAIGGISMGGFGALDIARLWPGRFCAVGAHSPALWRAFADSAPGAFDDANDFAEHDLLEEARTDPELYGETPVWIDVGAADPFRPTASALAGYLSGGEADVRFEVRPGGHSGAYWSENFPDYLAFYAEALTGC